MGGRIQRIELRRVIKFGIVFIVLTSSLAFFPPTGYGKNGSDIPNFLERVTMDIRISDASFASFLGEGNEDYSGHSIAGGGDVNGDGFNDILIGAYNNREHYGGQVYLVFGKETGWSMETDLCQVDASFWGEDSGDEAGRSVSIAGDVNGDGFDDILIGAPSNDDGGTAAGQVYLLFGKASGWSMDTDLRYADASFWGESSNDHAGVSVSGAGDVNGDGYDDILIGADGNDEGGTGTGQTYLILGRRYGWSMDTPLYSVNASFWGEGLIDGSGECVSGAGDVNKDGFDDILIAAKHNDEGGENAGQTYLILGKPNDWSKDTDLGNADASFWGEQGFDYSGRSVASAGDVNGDGFNDLLIGAYANDEGGQSAGQTYLIFGKTSDWSMDTNLSLSDASFIGEDDEDWSGYSVSGAGDINGDGYDDILIGAVDDSDGGVFSGQTYLIYGKGSGWSMNRGLHSADASFWGMDGGDCIGHSVAGAGDVNNDGIFDIIISGPFCEAGGTKRGQTYLISGPGFTEPKEIFDIKIMNEAEEEVLEVDIEDPVVIELKGRDGNPNRKDRVRVNLSVLENRQINLTIALVETGISTGIYRGNLVIPASVEYLDVIRISAYIDPSKFQDILVNYPYRPRSISSIGIYGSPSGASVVDKLDLGQTCHIKCVGDDSNELTVDLAFLSVSSDRNPDFHRMLTMVESNPSSGTYWAEFTVPGTMNYFENVTFTSLETPSRTAQFMVHTPVQVRAKGPYLGSEEDEEYRSEYYNFGYNNAPLTAETNADWLTWDPERNEFFGTPNNSHVGNDLWRINVTASDIHGNTHSLDYVLVVMNRDPKILTEPITESTLYEEYFLDVDSDDDGQGEITWFLNSNSPFLTIDKKTGILKGTPIEGDQGEYFVNVQVQDGNGGSDNLIFNLTVVGRNDRPQIINTDITQIEQDTPFRRDYDVFDPDEEDMHLWTLRTDADWLSMENETGVIFGTPDGYDVGEWLVNITVTDQGGLSDYREFTFKVLDVKDKPRFDDVPADTEIPHGTNYYFDVNASDADRNDRVTFSVRTEPESTIVIDPDTGDLRWRANYRSMPSTGKGMKVTLTASDGQLFSTYDFYITVTPTQSPSSELVSPGKGARSRSAYTLLEWSGTDPENEPLKYILYLADSESYVSAKRSEDIVSNDIGDNFYNLTGLTQGKTYYWTVIPDDGCTYGKCLSGVFSFRVNNKPTVRSVEDQSAQAGEEFMVKVTGTDLDQDDTLTYRISSGPSGMMIRDSGMIVWTPKDSQVGVHTVKVTISDGYEESVLSFRIEVSEGEGSGLGLIIGVVVGILVLVIIGLLLYIFIIKGKGEEEKKDEMDDEAKKMLDEMEQKKREKEWEEAHIRPSEQQVISSVPLSAEEAHAQDKGGKLKSYEELYGKPTPDRDE